MRSSPSFLVVSRRGPEVLDFTGIKLPKGDLTAMEHEPLVLSSEENNDGITLYLKVNYKAILLVLVALDVVHLSLAELFARVFGLGLRFPL
jgi:hypothetical protein